MTRLALRILQIAASALSLGFIVPVLAQTGGKTYTGVCEDVLVPDYPRPGDPGVAIEDVGLIPKYTLHKILAEAVRKVESSEQGYGCIVRALVGDNENKQKSGQRRAI